MKDKIINILAYLAAAIIWVEFFDFFMQTLHGMQVFSFRKPGVYEYFMVLAFAPVWEEYVFRHVPLKLANKFNDQDITWFIIIITSVILGVVHGGVRNIFIQGVVGFMSALLYLRNGNSYWSSVVFHAMYNFYVIAL